LSGDQICHGKISITILRQEIPSRHYFVIKGYQKKAITVPNTGYTLSKSLSRKIDRIHSPATAYFMYAGSTTASVHGIEHQTCQDVSFQGREVKYAP
jgi:hypothetical protein